MWNDFGDEKCWLRRVFLPSHRLRNVSRRFESFLPGSSFCSQLLFLVQVYRRWKSEIHETAMLLDENIDKMLDIAECFRQISFQFSASFFILLINGRPSDWLSSDRLADSRDCYWFWIVVNFPCFVFDLVKLFDSRWNRMKVNIWPRAGINSLIEFGGRKQLNYSSHSISIKWNTKLVILISFCWNFLADSGWFWMREQDHSW